MRYIAAGDGITYGPFPPAPPVEVEAVPHLTVSELVEQFAGHLYARPFHLGQSMTLDYITGTDDLARTRDTLAWWKEKVGGEVTAERWPPGDAYVWLTIPGICIQVIVSTVDDDAEFPWYGRLGLTAAEVKA